jgi:hypothetical protein
MKFIFIAIIVLSSTQTAALATTFPQSSVTVDNIGSGGYQASYYQSGVASVPEVLVVGVYETSSNHSFDFHTTGTGHVRVVGSALAPVDIVVSSYEPVQWIFDGPGVSYISKVLVNSFYPSTVVGIDSSKVLDRSGAQNLGTYAYAWPSATGGSNTPLLFQNVQTLLGAPVSAFGGAYNATAFTIILTPVPEPATATLLLLGMLGCGWRRGR